MPQELHAIIINLSWLTLSVGFVLGIPAVVIGGYYYKKAQRLPSELVFRYAMIISISAFIITIVLWLYAWIY